MSHKTIVIIKTCLYRHISNCLCCKYKLLISTQVNSIGWVWRQSQWSKLQEGGFPSVIWWCPVSATFQSRGRGREEEEEGEKQEEINTWTSTSQSHQGKKLLNKNVVFFFKICNSRLSCSITSIQICTSVVVLDSWSQEHFFKGRSLNSCSEAFLFNLVLVSNWTDSRFMTQTG